ncbi:MAG: type 1 glutamine amidotransferase [Nocardioidaceae bacterium]
MRDSELTVALVYPDLLGTYGDRGNALALVRRARARGLQVRVVEVVDEQPLPRSADVYLIGGSEDATQLLALEALRAQPGAAETLAGSACLAVCAGFQLVAREFAGSDGHRVPGLGVVDVVCGRLPGPRAVGEVVAEPVALPGLATITGYENHQGDARLGPAARPLGRVRVGVGNGSGGPDRWEGAVQGGVVATYLHGPVLVRNPDLADHLLARVVGPLPPYEDEAVARLRAERMEAARHHGARA